MYVDVAAEKTGTKGTSTMAAEVKNFIGLSDMNEFQKALGQYEVYRSAFKRKDQKRELFLAIPTHFYEEIKAIRLYRDTLNALSVNVVVFEAEGQIITEWIK